uniref:Uncharacterized protein n=1 Tax=Romanomermis culicivorax TaxID=13658 RepID=A0A915J1E2_ROMCU
MNAQTIWTVQFARTAAIVEIASAQFAKIRGAEFSSLVLTTDPDRNPWDPRESGFKSLQNQAKKPHFGCVNSDPDPCLSRRIQIRDSRMDLCFSSTLNSK